MFDKNFTERLFGKGIDRKKMLGRREFQSNERIKQDNQAHIVFTEDKSSVVCMCPRCGYIAPHERGIPCRSAHCPICNIQLERCRKDEIKDLETKFDKKPVRKVLIIDITLCTGCGSCLDVCPTNAIVIENGKATIIENVCKKCRKCVLACPFHAIS